jgi:2'-5' RNA ligase
VDWHVASSQARSLTETLVPFDVELEEVCIFPGTKVIYLEVGRGSKQLRHLHGALNETSLAFKEPYQYHPHITLAQELLPEQVEQAFQHCNKRWERYNGPRSFRAERAFFVQNTVQNRWIDLDKYELGAVAVG